MTTQSAWILCVVILVPTHSFNEKLLSKFVSDFVSAAELSKNTSAASTIDGCSAEDIRAACFKAND
jgi:hypothetical protein